MQPLIEANWGIGLRVICLAGAEKGIFRLMGDYSLQIQHAAEGQTLPERTVHLEPSVNGVEKCSLCQAPPAAATAQVTLAGPTVPPSTTPAPTS